MKKHRKEKILKLLNTEIGKVQESAKKTDEASKQRLTGWSEAGDKYHAIVASDLAKSYLKRLELLKKELEDALPRKTKTVKPPCYITIVYGDGETMRLLLVENAVSLPLISFISVDSLLGKAVMGKSMGDKFDYELDNGKRYSGKVVVVD